MNSFERLVEMACDGASVPPVHPPDLQAIWHARRKDPDGATADELALLCSPDANIPALWLRSSLIDASEEKGELASFTATDGFLPVVFECASRLPIVWPDFDEQALARALHP